MTTVPMSNLHSKFYQSTSTESVLKSGIGVDTDKMSMDDMERRWKLVVEAKISKEPPTIRGFIFFIPKYSDFHMITANSNLTTTWLAPFI